MLQIKNVLVPTDCSHVADRAHSYAVELARRFDGQIHLLHVCTSPRTRSTAEPLDYQPIGAADVARDLRLPEQSPPVPTVQAEVEEPSVPSAIVNYAREHKIDLIVMGGRGRHGLSLNHLGGVAGPVVRYSPCSVMTVRDRLPEHGLQRILVPVDLTDASRIPLTVARNLAALYGSEIDLVVVVEHILYPTPYGLAPILQLEEELRQKWESALREFWMEVDGPDVPVRMHVRAGAPGPEIINLALQRSSDMIVIGTHGKTGLRRIVLGSVAEQVIYRALCATLTVKTFGKSLLTLEAASFQADHAPA